ncbi:hypothetical protein SAMN06296056_1011073 [Priestia filamentosa]|nr:hypothetical protein SAMN06296056_1011073 [Priestia filamentosa]
MIEYEKYLERVKEYKHKGGCESDDWKKNDRSMGRRQ